MLKSIYFFVSGLKFRFRLKKIGSLCKLRLNGRVINGKYVSFGNNVEIEKNWIIAVYPEYANQFNPVRSKGGVYIGDKTYINRNLTIYCADTVAVGTNCLFGSNVLITDNNHGIDLSTEIPFSKQPLSTEPVIIGDNCWIGESAKILKGGGLGANCIVAAGSIVTKKFPSNVMVAGIPARIVKQYDFVDNKWS